MPVMRIAKRFDRRNMHARLLGNRCDAFGIAHGLVITFPRTDNKRLVRRRMVANGVDGNLLLVCGAIAAEEPADHTAFTAIGRFELAAGGDDGAEQIRMVRTDLQRTCGSLRKTCDCPILCLPCRRKIGSHPVDHVFRQVGQHIAVHRRIHA